MAFKRILILSGLLFGCGARAWVTPNPLFSDGAVLQRDTTVPIWGSSTREGEKVTVELDGKAVSTVAHHGKWLVRLPPTPAGGSHSLTITGDNAIRLKDILFGEVWVCSGQSNMERQLGPHANQKLLVGWKKTIAEATIPGLRFFTVKKATSDKPLKTVSGKWINSVPASAKEFSAVGFYFARDLKKSLGGIPVGIIHTSWGGTPAEAWMSRPALETLPFLKPALAAHDKERAKKNGARVSECAPAALRNGMITPLMPYAIRGVIWYQGESNNPRTKEYRSLFPALIADWRKDWEHADFPFLFVQIAPSKDTCPELREAQLLALGVTKHTAMAVTLDVGDANDIHPANKEPIGARLALAARVLAYGEKIEYSGPVFSNATFADGQALVSFTHTGSGLILKEGLAKGFSIAGSDKIFRSAKVEIVGDHLVLSAPDVLAPMAVRYAWADVPEYSLFNREGLPASPFRSDVE